MTGKESSLSPQAPDRAIDFVLVTALAEERDAVLDKLPGFHQLPPAKDDIRTYYQSDLPITFPDNTRGTYRVMVMCLLGMGRVQAVAATADAIRRWHPRYLLLVGIAGGLAASGVRIGDILISDQVVDYELQKLTSNGPEIRWDVQRADARLLNAYHNYRDEAWQNLIKVKRPVQGKITCNTGTIASGDKVIAFGDILARYQAMWPKLIGVEMEAAGAATAAFQSPDAPGFFMVRAVSDLADENKSSRNVQKWRAYACDTAAAFTISFLSSGPIPLSEGANQEKTVTAQPEDSRHSLQNNRPAVNHYENTVFVSYAWGGESEHTVDELGKAFTARGIRTVRDKKDIDYKGSIREFEQRIAQGQCIVLVISDKYLRSEHCMYELLEVEKHENLLERIFPIVLADARLFKAEDRLLYIQYWEEKIEQLNQAIKQVKVITDLAGIIADLDKYARIRAKFDHLTYLISDRNVLTPEIIAANDFSILIGAVESTMVKKETASINNNSESKPDEVSKSGLAQLHPMPETLSSTQRSLKVYLSYSSAEKPAVRELYRRLCNDGMKPWMDEEDLLPGQPWEGTLRKVLSQSDAVIICLSRTPRNNTGFAQEEIRIALDIAKQQPEGKIFIIPVRLEACEVPEQLSQWQWVNLFQKNGYGKLLRSLRACAQDNHLAPFVSAPAPQAARPQKTEKTAVEPSSIPLETSGVRKGKLEKKITIGEMDFMLVPAGKFVMGSREDNPAASDNEKPQHTLELPDYFIERTPVTNQQFIEFITATKTPHQWIGGWQKKLDHPVVNVSWEDAVAFCQWYNNQHKAKLPIGMALTLPTEAEWEKAARGEFGKEYPWGDEFDVTR